MSTNDRKLDNCSLPRGLITRSGIPMTPNQRLPSLKSSLNSNSIISKSNFAINSPVTRSGALKRIFKPTIPETKRQEETASKNRLPSNFKVHIKKETTKKPKSRRKNEYIQVKPLVFTGISQRSPNESVTKETSITNHASSKSSKQTYNRVSTISKEEEMIYCDDFIVRFKEPKNDTELNTVPKGWSVLESVENEPTSLHHEEEWWSSQDKLVLMQLPELLGNRNEGKIGKLRVYKSGKIELVDNSSKLIFDLVQSRDKDSAKAELGPNQEVIAFLGKELMCLGSLKPEDTFLMVPRILDFLNLN